MGNILSEDKHIGLSTREYVLNAMKKRLLYYIGSDAGFFSEYNNMVLAIRYCQRNDVNFILSSGGGVILPIRTDGQIILSRFAENGTSFISR